jgi:hypothetical protein
MVYAQVVVFNAQIVVHDLAGLPSLIFQDLKAESVSW